jgi:hypothetical protein
MIATGPRLVIASSLLVSITSEMLLSTNGIGVYLQRSQENFPDRCGASRYRIHFTRRHYHQFAGLEARTQLALLALPGARVS